MRNQILELGQTPVEDEANCKDLQQPKYNKKHQLRNLQVTSTFLALKTMQVFHVVTAEKRKKTTLLLQIYYLWVNTIQINVSKTNYNQNPFLIQ